MGRNKPFHNFKSKSKESWIITECRSSTFVVIDANLPKRKYAYGVLNDGAWLTIRGPMDDDDSRRDRNTRKCCEDIRDFLNGGMRPVWLSDLREVNACVLKDLDGTLIRVTGPMIDKKPPGCFWVDDQSDVAKRLRAILMARLLMREIPAA